MKATERIQITEEVRLDPSTSPVVVIGANGTGKSTLGVQLAAKGAHRISARRALDIPGSIPLQSLPEATKAREQTDQIFASRRTEIASDCQSILIELNAQELELGRQVREDLLNNRDLQPDREQLISGLDHVKRIWDAAFPERTISFARGEPKVQACHQQTKAEYPQNEMSDGERQVLYLAAKIATIQDESVIVVDEPETQLHPTLARRIWDLLQDFKPRSRFIYITHDLLFALSRRTEAFIVCRASGKHELVNKMPPEVAAEILGAASMPLVIDRVIFCEGKTTSLDIGLFDVWFDNTKVAVYPVGGCDGVLEAVEGMKKVPSFQRVTVSGIVDRDERCKEELDYLKTKGVHVLPVAEVEHLYCLPEVLRAVAQQVGKTSREEQTATLKQYLEALIRELTPGTHRLAFQRARDRIRWNLRFPLAEVKEGPDATTASTNLATAYARAIEAIDPALYYSDADKVVRRALAGTIEDILCDLPGKFALGLAAQTVGVTVERYTDIVRKGLRGEMEAPLMDALIEALKPHLPPRSG